MIHTTVVASLKPQHRSTCTFPHHDHHSLDLQPHPHSRSLRRFHYGRLRRLCCKQMGDRDECAVFPCKAFSVFNSFLTDDDTRSFCGQCRSRSDCTERGV